MEAVMDDRHVSRCVFFFFSSNHMLYTFKTTIMSYHYIENKMENHTIGTVPKK